MHSIATLVALLAASAIAVPAAPYPSSSSALTNFLLVTTSQSTQASNSSLLAHVNATSLFDPYDQKNFLLRLIGPGYGSLPTFNLTDGYLSTLSEGPEGFGEAVYNSTVVETGDNLQFLPTSQSKGSLALKDGYLLTVGGKEKGWGICPGAEGELVIAWQNSTCTDTYIQAVAKAPY